MTAAPFVAHLANAGELVASKRFDQAEGEILQALSAAPGDAKALTLLALVRYKLGRLQDAHTTYRQIAVVAPQDAGARRNLGLLSLKLGRLDEALPELEMAVRIAPGDTRAWSYLGYAYAKKGEAVQAAAAFRRAGQDALANELEQAAKVQRPPTPSRAGSGRASAPAPHPFRGAERSEARAEAPAAAARPAAVDLEPPPPREVQPVALLSFVLSQLAQEPAPSIAPGALRLAVADEAHARADAILAGTGPLTWSPGVRRAQGRSSDERMGRAGGAPYFRLTGGGEVWIAGAAGRWLPLRLEDDVLYIREDRVLAFDGALAWEAGSVPNTTLRMLQFRGRGTVVLELPGDAVAIKVTEERPALIAGARLYGWVGRLVPHGARLSDETPFQLGCQGEGVVLLETIAG